MNYGGFEQNAENLSVHWVRKGHDVTVYNPSEHPYRNATWQGVRIKRVFSAEPWLRGLSPFIFDYLCLRDALSRDFDVLLELGFAPWSLFYRWSDNPNGTRVVTNMDGLDWKREKWG